MLGGFTIRLRDRVVDGGVSRSHKVWLLMAYLIWNRGRQIPEEELMALLWSGSAKSVSRPNALKTILHRARAALDGLGEGWGRRLILRREGELVWNEEIPLVLDAEIFAKTGEPASLEEAMARLSLYQGAFLPQLAELPWPAAIGRELRRQYLDMVAAALPQLRAESRWEETAALCRAAVEESPLVEELYQCWMEALLALRRREEAVAAYELLRDRLFAASGTMPCQESRELYRATTREEGGGPLTLDQVMDQLRETPGSGGALFCEYDFFKTVCQAAARDQSRSGQPAHLALFTLAEGESGALTRRSLDRAAGHLREVVQGQLRRGDVAAACCASQFAVLLPRASYENSRLAARRVLRAFFRQYPHAPVTLRAEICPLPAGRGGSR